MRTSTMVMAVVGLAWPIAATARQEERVFKPGELVRVGGDQTMKIIACKPEKISRAIECSLVLWHNGGPASIKNTMFASQIAAAEARVKEAEELAAMIETPEAQPGDAAIPAPVAAEPQP